MLAAGAAGLVLVALALVLPPRPHGDAGEYLLMTESWRQHGSPDLRPSDLESLRRLTRDAGAPFDDEPTVANYRRARDGRLYCYHFWAYPLAGLPARYALERLGLDPLRALPLTNALLFATGLLTVAALPWDRTRRLWLAALLALSPALAFLLWPHPEVFSFALATAALAALACGSLSAAALAAALASLQNPPLVLLVGGLVLAAWVRARPQRAWGRAALATAAALPALLPMAFFQYQFGVFNLSVRPAEAAESLSLRRALDLLLDPNLGLLPHAPLTLAAAAAAALVALARRRFGAPALVFGLLPLLMFACTANSNWNNDTSGPSRYGVWLFPILAFAAAGETGGPPTRALSRGAATILALAVAWQGALLLVRGGPLARSDYLEHSWAARLVLDRWPRRYRPAPEVFVERTVHHEEPVEGPVAYRGPDGRCRKAWLQPRHADRLEAMCGAPAFAEAARLQTLARAPDLKRAGTYVDY